MKSSGVLRFALAASSIALTAILLQARGRTEVIPNRLPLSSFPAQLGNWAKYYLVADSIRMNRSDGALVRITTDMFPGETPDAAQQRVLPFASAVSPLLDDYIPR